MPLSRILSFRLRWGRSDERGFALPFSLMALAVTAILSGAALYAAKAQSMHARRQEDADYAYNLAYSCLEEAFSNLERGHATSVVRLVYGDSGAQATIKAVAAGVYQVAAVSHTAAGGSAALTAILNTAKKEITAWQQQP